MFKIEKSKKVPVPRRSWPFKDMEVGDSVLFKDSEMSNKAKSYAHVYGLHSQKKFSARKEGNGVRIWRVA